MLWVGVILITPNFCQSPKGLEYFVILFIRQALYFFIEVLALLDLIC